MRTHPLVAQECDQVLRNRWPSLTGGWLVMIGAIFLLGLCAPGRASGTVGTDDRQVLLGLAHAISRNHELYPPLAPYVTKYGLVPLAGSLLREDKEELQILGLELANFHQLVMLKSDIIGIINDERSLPEVRMRAFQTLPSAGVSLEDALASVSSGKTRVDIITGYALIAPYLRSTPNDRIWVAMTRVMESPEYSSEIRNCAWLYLSNAHRRIDGAPVLSDEGYQSWADKLKVPLSYRVEGLERRAPKDLRERLLGFLKSEDTVARVYAASFLAARFNEPKALPVLVDSMASFGVPMRFYTYTEASVGFCAFQALSSIDDGALMKEMWAGLTSEEKNVLAGVVGKGSGAEKLEERVSQFLLAFDSLHVQEKNKVASIMMPWFKRNLARFQWDPDSSHLHLIIPVHP